MERQELLNYVKDVYGLWKKLYPLQELYDYYREVVFNTLEQDKEKICFSEEFTKDNKEMYELDRLTYGRLPEPNTYMATPSEFATLNFVYRDVNCFLPPRYRSDLDAVSKKLSSNIFTKGKAFDCSSTSKLRKEYQQLYTIRYNEELAQKQMWIEPIINNAKKEFNEYIVPNCQKTDDLIEKLYTLEIIHPKYRNFMAVAQIYEYLETGRCDTLEGPNGAYNLYEQELRQNIIIDHLEQVIDRLDTLNQTMGRVCEAIYESNRLLTNIANTVSRIEANTALIAYNTQCIAYNTEIANKYNF